jgi:hypothetical protein
MPYPGEGQQNNSPSFWKIPVPWGDGAIHEVLLGWVSSPREKNIEGEMMKSLHCIAAYLRDPPTEDRFLRPYKPTRCIR